MLIVAAATRINRMEGTDATAEEVNEYREIFNLVDLVCNRLVVVCVKRDCFVGVGWRWNN